MLLNKTEQNIGTLISFFVIILFFLYLIFGILGIENELTFLIVFGSLFIIILCLCIFTLRQLRKKEKLIEVDYINIGVQRYFLGLFMIFYGIPKLLGNFFDYQLFALDSKLIDISEFELAWYYFGKSRWQELFAGIMEFVPGLLLFNRRTYYFASLILLPVTAQVFILNLFFKIGGITFPAATILLACNIYIVYSQKEKISLFFKSLDFFPPLNLSRKALNLLKLSRWSAYFLIFMVVLIKIRPILFKSEFQKNYQKLVGVYTLEKMTRNNVSYAPQTDSTYYKDLYIEKQSRWNILRRFNNKVDAFILKMNPKNDSISLYINKGGTGDEKDIIDSVSVLKGAYKLEKDLLRIKGIQLNDTLELLYKKQALLPKKWFW